VSDQDKVYGGGEIEFKITGISATNRVRHVISWRTEMDTAGMSSDNVREMILRETLALLDSARRWAKIGGVEEDMDWQFRERWQSVVDPEDPNE
jgi:hypothetical protein